MTTHPYQAFILAGGIRPCPLQQQLRQPILCLPLSPDHSLLSAWIDVFMAAGSCQSLSVILSDDSHAPLFKEHIAHLSRPKPGGQDIRVVVEPGRWRGTAGVLRDIVQGEPDGPSLVVVEGACLPPPSLEPMTNALDRGPCALVGIGSGSEPAGVYCFSGAAIQQIPAVGFFDIKEQLLPRLYRHGTAARAMMLTHRALRIRDRVSYLSAVRHEWNQLRDAPVPPQTTSGGNAPSSALIDGACVIHPQAVIADDAIVTNSVILAGAVINTRVTVSRSIIGSNVEVSVGAVVTDTIMPCRPEHSSPANVSSTRIDRDLQPSLVRS